MIMMHPVPDSESEIYSAALRPLQAALPSLLVALDFPTVACLPDDGLGIGRRIGA
jgi:hypothetical protein